VRRGFLALALLAAFPAAGQAQQVFGTGLSVGSLGGLGANVAAFLATPSSANLVAALTDETGSGALVFANTPTLVAPVLGDATGTSLAVTQTITVGAGWALSWSGRAIQTSPGAGTLQFGNVDVNTGPTAQTLRSQGALAGGTSDVAGANWTFIASPGKGTGAGGSFIFQTAPAGSTGTVVNTPVQRLSIAPTGLVSFGLSSATPAHLASAQATAPALTSCGTGSPSISGTDTSGTVTMGTSATGCVITFNVAYTAAPTCTVTWRATPLASQSYTVSTTAITTTQTSTSSNLLDYICVGKSGG
jgi:hypothetical protein